MASSSRYEFGKFMSNDLSSPLACLTELINEFTSAPQLTPKAPLTPPSQIF